METINIKKQLNNKKEYMAITYDLGTELHKEFMLKEDFEKLGKMYEFEGNMIDNDFIRHRQNKKIIKIEVYHEIDSFDIPKYIYDTTDILKSIDNDCWNEESNVLESEDWKLSCIRRLDQVTKKIEEVRNRLYDSLDLEEKIEKERAKLNKAVKILTDNLGKN